MPRRALPKVEGATQLDRGVVPGAAKVVPAASFQPATPESAPVAVVPPAAALPEPHGPLSDSTELTDRERAELAACEAALDNFRRAFWGAGQALEVIRSGRHYKETHKSFESYTEDRWEMRRAQADRLIRAWRLGRKLDPVGSSFGARVVESQVRPLLPVAGRHGDDAAVTVYQTTAEVRNGKVTAVDLEDAVDVLPADWDPDVAVKLIRARLVDGVEPGAGPIVPPARAESAERFVAAAGKAWGALRQAVQEDVIRAAAAENPGYVRKFVTDLRELADDLEKVVQ